MSESHRYLFVHIMKTAGTALRRRLVHHFGEHAVYPDWKLDKGGYMHYLATDPLHDALRERGDQIRLITGHFCLRTADEIEGEVTTFTLLRQPVDRVLSHLRQRQDDRMIRFLEGRKDQSAYAGKPLDEIYDEFRGRALIDNNMTRMLACTQDEFLASVFKPESLSREHLDAAKAGLAALDSFGTQERFDEFCDGLTERYGWDLGAPKTANVTEPTAVSTTLRARIAEDNALDLELYEFATQLLEGRGDRTIDTMGEL